MPIVPVVLLVPGPLPPSLVIETQRFFVGKDAPPTCEIYNKHTSPFLFAPLVNHAIRPCTRPRIPCLLTWSARRRARTTPPAHTISL